MVPTLDPWLAPRPVTRPHGRLRQLTVAVLGAMALGLGTNDAAALGDNGDSGDSGDSGDYTTDPTVGTLPMRIGAVDDVPGPDQVIYLVGSVDALRGALSALEVRWQFGQSAAGVWALPEGRAWVEFHGAIGLHWSDLRVLEGIEIGIGAGFEGGGMLCAVESAFGMTAPTMLEVGRSMPLSLERLGDAGLLQRPLILHGLHQTGARSRVTFEAAAGGLTIAQSF